MMGIQVLAWDWDKNVAELNRLMGSQPSPSDNLVSKGITVINKNRKRHRKRLSHYHKNE